MHLLFLLLAIGTAVAVPVEEQVPSLEGAKVYRLIADTDEKLSSVLAYDGQDGYDILKAGHTLGDEIHLLVTADNVEAFESVLDENEIDNVVMTEDVQAAVEAEATRQSTASNARLDGRISFEAYHRYDVIVKYLEDLAENYSDFASLIEIGESFEGRTIYGLKISSGGTGKPAILIDAGIHAREWIAPATVIYIISQLVEETTNSHLFENVDWYIIPVLNPDGYEYTHTTYRLWRKTRSTRTGNLCRGVDPNRNFEYYWMLTGASSASCSETYAGPEAFSELETQALRDFVLANNETIKLYLTFHSYGNYFLYPWGYTSELPDNEEELRTLAEAADEALSTVRGTRYTIGTSTNVLYAAAGGSDDWVKGVGGVELAYTLELPGGGSYGFDLPASDIGVVGQETFLAIRVFLKYIDDNFINDKFHLVYERVPKQNKLLASGATEYFVRHNKNIPALKPYLILPLQLLGNRTNNQSDGSMQQQLLICFLTIIVLYRQGGQECCSRITSASLHQCEMMPRQQEKPQKILQAALLCLNLFLPFNHAIYYNGYTVYQLSPNTSEKIAVLRSLQSVSGYDFWKEPRRNTSHLMVAPEQRSKFEKQMAAAHIQTTIAINNVAEHLRENATTRYHQEEKSTENNRRMFLLPLENRKNFSFDRYLSCYEMVKLIESLVDREYVAKIVTIGTTYQGRKIFAVKLSTSDRYPVIVIDGGIHAREWVSPLSVLYILRKLIDDKEVLQKLTFYIVPVINPDGYEYSMRKDRYWRKTMSKHSGTKCRGVDGNRNFDSHWNESGSEGDPCSQMYSGPEPFSEAETRALRDLIIRVKPLMYLTFHSYGGLILYPWGYGPDLPDNWQELHKLGKKASDEVKRLFNTEYEVGTSTNLLYPASGGSDDWSMEKAGVEFVYCIELEDFGSLFDPPPHKLTEIVQHAYTLVQVFINHVLDINV
ncbi:uncharacterized protein LOC124405932 [Diprion similis]|uniref:uncharacterized protein LOC124405932 n=1 Tax=Diprion similis TaxID=362088 RepID=UPI001EF7DEE4|nr:uncharacterized protein LOC124405932 [Diprion similis]